MRVVGTVNLELNFRQVVMDDVLGVSIVRRDSPRHGSSCVLAAVRIVCLSDQVRTTLESALIPA